MTGDQCLPAGSDKLDVRIVEIAVVPAGQPLFSEMTTRIAIDDEAAGEFVKVSQEGGHTDLQKWVNFDPEEWPVIRQAIDFMVKQCRNESQ